MAFKSFWIQLLPSITQGCSAPISCTGLASKIPAHRLALNPDFCYPSPLSPLLTFLKYQLQCSSAQRPSRFSDGKGLYCQPECSTISVHFTLHDVFHTCLPHRTLNSTAGDESDSRAPPTQHLSCPSHAELQTEKRMTLSQTHGSTRGGKDSSH